MGVLSALADAFSDPAVAGTDTEAEDELPFGGTADGEVVWATLEAAAVDSDAGEADEAEDGGRFARPPRDRLGFPDFGTDVGGSGAAFTVGVLVAATVAAVKRVSCGAWAEELERSVQ